ncbi:outer membrane protein assembly factor BamE [Salmonella enterica subsp. enterica serovar Teko]|nr:hypothetical protein [Salmonella enterica]EAA7937557.1 outer membrane protein assembly factor BamE [Salmonella enterica subsp. enterica serovar Teko]EDV9143251.1 outer membrane protein assembly factor BamE [Salmonella enterica subsp. enterica serovar Gombe]EDV9732149.1 outer membrane protein assembly factor BamE [Salmonella enterica subsp. enterica]EAQ2080607.1 outer membrane protein assembly factor BamE [Salmonella enterica]
MKLYPAKLLFLIVTALLSGCYQNPSSPENDGSVKEIVWPTYEKAQQGGDPGIFQTPERISLLKKGMTKNQVYLLIGKPHYNEGFFSVREWDYLLHFRPNSNENTRIASCMLKIIFNSDKLISNIYWKPIDSKASMCPPVPDNNSKYIVNSDIVFGLNQYKLNHLSYSILQDFDKTISDTMGKTGFQSINIYGYSDKQGHRNYNMELSKLRARSVADYFINNGFPKDKIFFRGLGETMPETNCSGLRGDKLTKCLLPDRNVIIIVKP